MHFDFMEEAFGQSQEMVVFVTELNVNYYSVWFIKENGCDKYYQYNRGLLFDEQQAEIMAEMDELERNFNIKDQSQLSILLSSGSTVQSIVMKQKLPPITLETGSARNTPEVPMCNT